jgi:hypothetical protein
VKRLTCLILAAVIAWLIPAVPVETANGEAPISIHAYNDTNHSN